MRRHLLALKSAEVVIDAARDTIRHIDEHGPEAYAGVLAISAAAQAKLNAIDAERAALPKIKYSKR